MIFAFQRGYGEVKGGWEFLGDKIEPEVVCRIFLMFGLMKVGRSL